MTSLTYTRYELVRVFRNRRFLIFSLGFPLALYLIIAAPNRSLHNYSGTASPCRCTTWSAWRPSGR